jgi:hypothetical protein
MSHTKTTVGEKRTETPVGASGLGGDELQIMPMKVDRVFRGLRQIVGTSLLGGVLAGAIAGSGVTVALGAIALGAEGLGLVAGAVTGAALLFIKH